MDVVVVKDFSTFESDEDLFDWYIIIEGASHGYEQWAEARYEEYEQRQKAEAEAKGLPLQYSE